LPEPDEKHAPEAEHRSFYSAFIGVVAGWADATRWGKRVQRTRRHDDRDSLARRLAQANRSRERWLGCAGWLCLLSACNRTSNQRRLKFLGVLPPVWITNPPIQGCPWWARRKLSSKHDRKSGNDQADEW